MILMDLQMPEMDGYEAVQEIRRLESPEKHTPIIALTASVLESDRNRCLEAGMDGYLAKPIDPERLSETVQTCLGTIRAARATSGGY
jgi:CheY-like chemotaxis protein